MSQNPSSTTESIASEHISLEDIPTTVNNENQTNSSVQNLMTPPKKPTKKIKSSKFTTVGSTSSEIEKNKTKEVIQKQLEPAKQFITDPDNHFTLNYDTIVDLIENTVGAKDIISIAHNYTDKLEELGKMLRTVYPHLKERSIKTRFTKIIKKLSSTDTVDESDSSVQSTY